MIFNDAGPTGQCEDLVVVDGKSRAIFGRDGDVLDHFAAADVVDQLEFLGSQQFFR